MYNENSGFSPQGFIIKAILVILFVFLLMWLLPLPNMKPVYDRIFAENLESMKTAAKNYYTADRLPKENNKTVKMSLNEMYTNKLVLAMTDSDNKKCDANASYVEVMKTETEYVIKTSLTCGGKTDYVVDHVGCQNICEDCKVAEEKPTVPSNSVTPSKPVTPSKTYVPSKPSKPTTPTKTKVIEIKYGKSSSYVDTGWIADVKATGTTKNNGITTTVDILQQNLNSYQELWSNSKVIYSSGYVSAEAHTNEDVIYQGTRILDLNSIGVSQAAQAMSRDQLNLRITNTEGFTSGTTDYYNYIHTRNTDFKLQSGCPNGCIFNPDEYIMRASSLKYWSNFVVSYNQVYWNGYAYQVATTAHIYNTNGVIYYYDENMGTSIYFMPHKFTIAWNEPVTRTYYTYRYRTTTSYDNEWVEKGSAREKELINRGYSQIDYKEYWK